MTSPGRRWDRIRVNRMMGKPLSVTWFVAAWAVFALVCLAALAWTAQSGLLTWSSAMALRDSTLDFVVRHPALAYSAYILVFVALALALIPIQLWVVVLAGMLFGFWPATLVSFVATVLGGVAVFLAARGLLAGYYSGIVGKYLKLVEREFQSNQLAWLLSLRLVPVAPYCVGNLIPAFIGARTRPFAIALAICAGPYAATYSYVGDQARLLLMANTPPDISILTGAVAPVMLAIAVLVIGSILLRRMLHHTSAKDAQASP